MPSAVFVCAATQSGDFSIARALASKKSLLADEQSRRDVAWRRKRWKAWQGRFDPERLVFIDETWIKTNMAPLRGWEPKGQRLRGYTPHGRWRTMTFLAALRCDQLTAPRVSLMVRSMANASALTSSSNWSRPSSPETLSSSTIWEATRQKPHVRSSMTRAHDCGSFRPTRQTSIRSSRHSPRSSTGCEWPRNEPSRRHGAISAISSIQSRPNNAPITSKTQDMLPSKSDPL